MRVKIGKHWATHSEKKNKREGLRRYKDEVFCENESLKIELAEVRTANEKLYQKNLVKGFRLGIQAAINHIMKELKVNGNLEITESGADTEAMCDAAAEKIRSAFSQECDCDRIEQLCKQLEQVSKERDDALERLHRVNGSLRTLTAETSNEFVRRKCSASAYELKKAVGEPVFLQHVGLTGYWTVLKKYENGAFVFVDRDERECEYGSTWVAYRAENADE